MARRKKIGFASSDDELRAAVLSHYEKMAPADWPRHPDRVNIDHGMTLGPDGFIEIKFIQAIPWPTKFHTHIGVRLDLYETGQSRSVLVEKEPRYAGQKG
jgi:hypothetical protein